jgi:hypothetical protein
VTAVVCGAILLGRPAQTPPEESLLPLAEADPRSVAAAPAQH